MSNPKLKVSVQTEFLVEQSSAKDKVYTFAYFVTVENVGDIATQLLGRHWIIEEASGERQEVKGCYKDRHGTKDGRQQTRSTDTEGGL